MQSLQQVEGRAGLVEGGGLKRARNGIGRLFAAGPGWSKCRAAVLRLDSGSYKRQTCGLRVGVNGRGWYQ